MEIPCLHKFCGNNDILQKIKQLLHSQDKDKDINAEVPVEESPAKVFKQYEFIDDDVPHL